MKQKTIKKFKGLQLLRNSFDIEGALEIAENVVIIQDDIIQSRRGRGYLLQMPANQELNNVFIYQDTVLAISQNKLYKILISDGATAATTAGSQIITVNLANHGIQASAFIGNMNTSSRLLASLFENRQKSFGDFRIVTSPTAGTFQITADDQAATSETNLPVSFDYYTEFAGETISVSSSGIGVSRSTKANKNLYFTTDTGVLKIENINQPVLKAGVPDATDLSGQVLDTTAPKGRGFFNPNAQVAYRVTFARRDANQNLVEGPPSPQAVFVNQTNTTTSLTFASPTLTVNFTAHGLATNDEIYVTNSVGGTSGALIGFVFPVTVITANQFTINVSGFGVTGTPTSFSYGLKRNVRLVYSIPSGLSTEYTVNIYRSQLSGSQDASPTDSFRLVDEVALTASEINAGVGEFLDDIATEVITSNAELYTNQGQQGSFQTNNRPPFCEDLVTWKNITFYANTKQYRFLELNLVAPTIIANNDTVTIAGQTYIFKTNALNVANRILSEAGSFVAGAVQITHASHGFSTGDQILVYQTTGFTGTEPELTTYTINVISASVFQFTPTGITAGSGTVRYQGVKNAANQFFVAVNLPTSGLTGRSLSESIDETTRYLTSAVNINAASPVQAVYLFDPDSAPGKIRFIAKAITASTFSATMSANGTAFLPVLPTSGTAVSDKYEEQPAGIFWSKLGQPEAVPLVNFNTVGEADKPILRLAPLRDSVIIIKTDGVFRINGDNPGNLSFIPMDTTVFCKASDSVRILNNSAFFLSNQGFVQVTDTAVRIASRDIEPVISATFNRELEDVTGAVSSETDRMYMCSTILPNSASFTANVTRVYNYLTDTWTDFNNIPAILFNGEIDPKDRVIGIPFAERNYLVRERKSQNRLDYVEEDEPIYAKIGQWVTCQTTVGSDLVVATLSSPNGYSIGSKITISEAEVSLLSAFGSPSDVLGIRTVVAVNEKTVTFEAGANAVATGNGECILSKQIREYVASCTTITGQSAVVITTTEEHGLVAGNVVSIEFLSSALAAAFGSPLNLVGSRAIISVTPLTFVIDASASAIASTTADLTFSSNIKEPLLATRTTTTPRIGDCVFSNNFINSIVGLKTMTQADTYSLEFSFNYQNTSFEYNRLGTYIRNRIKFGPLNTRDTGLLKQSPEFQASFRNSIACSKLIVSFSTDSKSNSDVTEWDNLRTGKIVNFGGWGQIDWGDFSWGAEVSVNRQFLTQPSVLMRTYIPVDAMIGTFLQASLEHRRAGESIDLQSISIFTDEVTQRTSR